MENNMDLFDQRQDNNYGGYRGGGGGGGGGYRGKQQNYRSNDSGGYGGYNSRDNDSDGYSSNYRESRDSHQNYRHQDNQRDRDWDRRKDRDRDRDRDRRRGRDRDRDRSKDRSYGNSDQYHDHDERMSGDAEYDNSISTNYTPDDFEDCNSRGSNSSRSSSHDNGSHGHRSSSSSHMMDQDGGGHNNPPMDKGGEKWMTDTPTNTVLLRGLPVSIDEKDIRAELMMFGAPIKEVRLMRKKDTGVSRGFAFVEFQNITDAQRWMTENQGQLYMLNQYTVSMYYSTPKTGSTESRPPEAWNKTDWTCSKCGVHNFKRRDFCFKCQLSREESERTKEGDGFDQVGNNACNTLILRGLDALTMEENIISAFQRVTSLTLKTVKVIRDELTNTSRGYAFVEMNTVVDSTQVLDSLNHITTGFEIDGKVVMVNYAKNTFSTTMATLNQQQSQQQHQQQQQQQPPWPQQGQQGQWDYSQANYSNYYQGGDYSYQQSGDYSQAGYYDQNGQYYDGYDYSAYYGQGYEQAPVEGEQKTPVSSAPGGLQTDSTNAAAAVAQAAIQQAQAAKSYQKQQEELQKHILAQVQQQQKFAEMTPEQRLAHEAQRWSQQTTATGSSTTTTTTSSQSSITSTQKVTQSHTGALTTQSSSSDYPVYPVPDVSTYQYDETSGYYYDPLTGLYYDPHSQYYYQAQSGQFLYWDGEKQTYLPAPTNEEQDKSKPGEEAKGKFKDKDKKEKVKIAKKIAKDMEKWAKSLNAQKEALKDGFTRMKSGMQNQEKESAAADAGYAILEKKSIVDRQLQEVVKKKDDKKLMPPPPMPGKGGDIPGLVASYGGDSDSDNEEEDPSAGTDESKFIDLSKMACLLCKRQFPNKEGLQRHVQLSDLHKQNLDKMRKSSGGSKGGLDAQQYRDRAKERREKFGQPGPPPPKRRQPPPPPPQPVVPQQEAIKKPIGGENIGNKLLQKMGWSEGQGLGKNNQGRTDAVQAQRRMQNAGLGSRGSTYGAVAGETYKDTVKKMMFARYHELDQGE